MASTPAHQRVTRDADLYANEPHAASTGNLPRQQHGNSRSEHQRQQLHSAEPPAEVTQSMKHMQKTERVLRLELQRRSLKESLKDNDEMMEEIDAQLAFVAQVKKDWLHYMRKTEVERKQIMAQEVVARQIVEDEMADATENLVFLQWLPQLRKLKEKQQKEQKRQKQLEQLGVRPASTTSGRK